MKPPCSAPRALPRLAAIWIPLLLLAWIVPGFAWSQTLQGSPAEEPTAQADRVVAAINPAATTQLSTRLPGWVSASRNVGAPPRELQLDHLTVLLARSPDRERAFRQLLDDQQNRASPAYHRWLTPEQIGERYGVTQHDLDAVTQWLRSQGLQVEQVSKSRTVVSFSGPVVRVEAAFSVHFQRYALAADEAADGTPRVRLSISAAPRVPAALADVIHSFTGLTQIPVHPYGHARVRPMSPSPQFSLCSAGSTTCEHFITPQDFATIFDLQGVAFNQAGVGQRIAIVGRSRVDPTDLNGFITALQTANVQPNVLIPPLGTEPGTTNDGNQLEATIDVTRVSATAPYAAQDLILSADSQTQDGVFIAVLYAVDTVLDPVLNISFGSCEADAGSGVVQSYDNLFSQAAGEGMSVFVSSGDGGAAGCDRNNATPLAAQIKSPNYICSSSYVTCVGGTEFNDTANPAQYWSPTNSASQGSALGYIPEGGWNEPTYTNAAGVTAYQASASGGGVSSIIPKPSWQTGIGVPQDGFRDTPDVSFPASAHDGYFACAAFIGADCNQGYFAYVFGTSAAAPTMAAIAATLNDNLGGAGATLSSNYGMPGGNLNPILYGLASTSPSVFHDATVQSSGVTACSLDTPSMCNNSTPSPTALTGGLAGYQLTDGYDLVTGLGSLDVALFISAATPILLTPTVQGYQGVLQVSTTQTFPLQITVTGSGPVPTGTITWFNQVGTQLGTTLPLVNGVATLSTQLPIPGDYSLGVNYSGDANYSIGGTYTYVNATATPGLLIPSIQIVANPNSTLVEQPVVFTATVQGSATVPTGTVQFFFDRGRPSGSPVALVNGMGTSLPQVFLQPGGALVVAQYSGDAQYQGIASQDASLDVLALPAPVFQISAPALTLTAGQGTGNTALITLASQNYNDSITLTCKVTYAGQGAANLLPTCSLSNQGPFTLTPAASMTTVTATIGTVAPSGGASVASLPRQTQPRGTGLPGAGLAALAGLCSLAFSASARRLRKSGLSHASLVLGLLLGAVAGSSLGCGSSNSPSSPAPPTTPGTTTGSYLVTVTGASRTYTAATSFTLTVN